MESGVTPTLVMPVTRRGHEPPFDHVADRNGLGLLAGKLSAPSLGRHLVPRLSVIDAVCAFANARLVLMRAPAGFGKTTAMLQCCERMRAEGARTAWLTLDRADNDVSRFLVGLRAAVRSLVGPDDSMGDGVQRSSDSANGSANALMQAMRVCQEPFALFVDDLDIIHESSVFGLLREIVESLPSQGTVVIGSRTLPDIPLGRLRARGQLCEVDATSLRFSLAETQSFFSDRGRVQLSNFDVERLHRKTEGWVAALWLASIALERTTAQTGFVEQFSGSDGSISDYLAEEVLARQPPEIRDFLLRTSVLRQLDAELCAVVVPQADVRQILHQLASTADAMIVSLGGNSGAYRYHSLFAGFLQAQLEQERPGEARALHSAVARWYEERGRPVPAIDHAIEARDFSFVVRLLSQNAETLLAQGRMRLLSRWFAALPAESLVDRPSLQIVHMWAVAFTRGPWIAMEMLSHSPLRDAVDSTHAAHIRALRPTLMAMMDDYEEAYAVGRQGLAKISSAPGFAGSVLANTMATIVTVVGERREARALIDEARRGASPFNQMYSEAGEGLLDLQEGRLREAMARFRMAVVGSRADALDYTGGNAFAGVPYAAVLYEVDNLDLSEHLLRAYLPVVRDLGLPDHLMLAYLTHTRIALARGDVDQALRIVTEFEYAGHSRKLPRVVSTAKLERARLLLMRGHDQAARDALERADDPTVWARVATLRFVANEMDDIVIGRLRWDAYVGDASRAVVQLETEREAAHQASRVQRAMKLGVLQALALHRLGHVGRSMELLASVLRTASREGFVRMLLDEGSRLGPLLHALHDVVSKDEDPVFRDYVQRLAEHYEPVRAQDGASSPESSLMAEPLTRKEIRVLELVAEGYSNPSIAEKLFVSDSTVRTHLRNISTKLDARNRMQAVAIARRLGQIR
jgi:LuxR family maltose regulon positive regulatory protein